MKFLADENFPLKSCKALNTAGHIVEMIEGSDRGASDLDVIKLADMYDATILTFDSDFGTLVFRNGIYLLKGSSISDCCDSTQWNLQND